MKIRFIKDCNLEVIEAMSDKGEILKNYREDFHTNEVFEGTITPVHSTKSNKDEFVNFRFGDGSCIYGLHSSFYEIIHE